MSIRYTAEQLQRKFAGPAGAPGYARVADAYRAEGRFEEAIALCREGLGSRPLVAGYVVLGKTLVDAGRPEEAREPFEAALRLDPRCLSAMHALASLLGKLQWPDAAAGYYRSILEMEPWDAEIRSLLEGIANGGAAPAHAAAAPMEPFHPAAAEDTYLKPDGLQGDVLEVNLNDVADDFLPSGGDETALSLEDALAAGPAHPPEGDFSPAPDPGLDRLPMEGPAEPATGPETLGENAPAPISGSDVEERLDSLFGNTDGGAPSATATWTAAPFADGPTDASATATGELRVPESAPVPVPDPDLPEAPAPFELAVAPDLGAAPAAEAESPVQGEDIERRLDELFQLSGEEDKPKSAPLSASDLPVAPGPAIGETVALGEAVPFGDRMAEAGPAEAAPAEAEWVTGQDVADKLDTLFGSEPKARAPEDSPAAVAEAPSAPAEEAFPAASPFFAEKPAAGPGPGEALLSTESMLPSGWTGDAPQVTGADVEAQLDKLFDLEPAAGAAAPAPEAAAVPQRNPDETVTFERPAERPAAGEQGRLRESVADWLSRQEDAPAAGDTLILPAQGMDLGDGPGIGAEAKAGEDALGTLAPEDIPALSETASIEMVDGGDVAQRLDTLFADAPGVPAIEVPIFEPELSALPGAIVPESAPEPAMTLEMPIPEPDGAGTAEGSGLPPFAAPGSDEEESGLSASAGGAGPGAAGKAAPELAPMQDEEEGYPDEEEMSSQGAGANVATVTLAEIYFQQGLKEQALQIYRQLLEREPENESVRKRIAEIEASKPDSDRGPDSDPRRPRPGLKVPKRKK